MYVLLSSFFFFAFPYDNLFLWSAIVLQVVTTSNAAPEESGVISSSSLFPGAGIQICSEALSSSSPSLPQASFHTLGISGMMSKIEELLKNVLINWLELRMRQLLLLS